MAVLPEQRRDDGPTVAIAIVPIEIRTDAEGSVLHASETVARGTSHAGAHVTRKLHDEILSQLPDDFIRRMMNWARTIDGTPVSVSKLEERVDHTRTERPLPILLGEADDTHKAVRALPQRYQEVVTIFWTHLARDLRWMATSTPRVRLWRLGPASFREWLENGHERLMRGEK